MKQGLRGATVERLRERGATYERSWTAGAELWFSSANNHLFLVPETVDSEEKANAVLQSAGIERFGSEGEAVSSISGTAETGEEESGQAHPRE